MNGKILIIFSGFSFCACILLSEVGNADECAKVDMSQGRQICIEWIKK